jgi:hypothetical protein
LATKRHFVNYRLFEQRHWIGWRPESTPIQALSGLYFCLVEVQEVSSSHKQHCGERDRRGAAQKAVDADHGIHLKMRQDTAGQLAAHAIEDGGRFKFGR